jgi:hypothetical protein
MLKTSFRGLRNSLSGIIIAYAQAHTYVENNGSNFIIKEIELYIAVSSTIFAFSSSNWNQEQAVVLVGIDEYEIDGTINYQVDLEALGGGFDGVSVTLDAINIDDDY